MYGYGVVDLAAELATTDPFCCDRDGLADLVAKTQRMRCWLDALDARIALRSRRLADQGVCESPGTLLTSNGRRSAKDAEAAVQRAETCEQMPGFHDALCGGEVSAGHLDAIARLSASLDDAGRSELKSSNHRWWRRRRRSRWRTLTANAATSPVPCLAMKACRGWNG